MSLLFDKNSIRSFSVALFIFLLQYGSVAAQTTDKALAFDALTTNDGLSQGMVNSILQDRYGFMWFASNDGLNRYDGINLLYIKTTRMTIIP
jgi:ligand-binding sensor domain-containing protein